VDGIGSEDDSRRPFAKAREGEWLELYEIGGVETGWDAAYGN
jgi:hypothetical protein